MSNWLSQSITLGVWPLFQLLFAGRTDCSVVQSRHPDLHHLHQHYYHLYFWVLCLNIGRLFIFSCSLVILVPLWVGFLPPRLWYHSHHHWWSLWHCSLLSLQFWDKHSPQLNNIPWLVDPVCSWVPHIIAITCMICQIVDKHVLDSLVGHLWHCPCSKMFSGAWILATPMLLSCGCLPINCYDGQSIQFGDQSEGLYKHLHCCFIGIFALAIKACPRFARVVNPSLARWFCWGVSRPVYSKWRLGFHSALSACFWSALFSPALWRQICLIMWSFSLQQWSH